MPELMIDVSEPFVLSLKRLDRAERAKLRRVPVDCLEESPEVLSVVDGYVPAEPGRKRRFEITRLGLVATLWAAHDSLGHGSFGSAMLRLAQGGREATADRYMRTIISARTLKSAARSLSRATVMLKAAGIDVDWIRFTRDLGSWERPDRPPQKRWAQDFWCRKTKTTNDKTKE